MPLSNEEIENLFREAETDRVERKASYARPEAIKEAICALSNDLPKNELPGVIFIGQKDDLSCAGASITDELLRQLGGLRSEGLILPIPQIHVSKRTIDGCDVATIVVEPSDRPPVRYNGRTFIRVGPRRAIATLDEERRLTERQLWRNLPFDSKPFAGTTVHDLDQARFEQEYVSSAFTKKTMDDNHRSYEDKLRALRLISPDETPNAAALLLVGKDPRAFLPGAYIQFIRINGLELYDEVVDNKEISGTVQDQIRELDATVRINNRTSSKIGGIARIDEEEYPSNVLEQLVRNAILHRNYDSSHAPVKFYWFSDRIEIHNSGGLFGDVTPETIWRGATAYRNPLLAEGMKHLGLVERFGYGLTRVKSVLDKSPSLRLRTEFVETFVAFILEKIA